MHVSGDNYAKDIIQYRLFESYKLLSVAIFSFINCAFLNELILNFSGALILMKIITIFLFLASL